MIKFTHSRIDAYAWMTMGGQMFDSKLGDIRKRVQQCQESIPMYEELKNQKIKRLFEDTEVIEKEYTYDPLKQEEKMRLKTEEIQEFREQINKII